jgi:chromosome partitioning protein
VEPDAIDTTLATVLMKVINDEPIEPTDGILHHAEGVDVLPANIELSGLEVSMINVMSRETILRGYLESVRQNYDYILIDCMPSLGMLTINALVAADTVIIPVQAAYLPVKGLQQLMLTISKVTRQLNRRLKIDGILLTMVDFRTNYARDISAKVREAYGKNVRIFNTAIPVSVRAAETSAEGRSIYSHDPNGKVAKAYMAFTEEVLG